MKAAVLTVTGTKKSEITLPKVFSEPVRQDLIKRAVLAMQSHSYQPQARNEMAGKRKSVYLSKRRRHYRGVYGVGRSRTPRKIMSRQGAHIQYEGSFSPHTKGGRAAHPAILDKKISDKINTKERRLAVRSGIAASADKGVVGLDMALPIIIEEKFESIKKTKDVVDLLDKIKVPLKGVGPLFIVSKRCNLLRSAGNIGDVVMVKDLNAGLLAPGTRPGRICIWSEDALKELEKLFGG
jgi:large subunit ribosomal protein L4e